MNVCCKIFRASALLSRSNLSSAISAAAFGARNVGAYQGHGKTTLDFMNRSITDYHTIIGYSQFGFRIENGVFVVGPMIIHDNTVLGWNIRNDEAITEDSLEFFRHIYPPLDLLVLGLSNEKSLSKFNRELIVKFKKLNIPIEVLPSSRAVEMYNFIAGTRNVAGAFLPPKSFKATTLDYVSTVKRHNTILGPESAMRHETDLREQLGKMGIEK